MFAPIIAGFIADGQGWQWVFYWAAIFCSVALIFLFFLLEETNFDRQIVGIATSNADPTPPVTSDLDAEKVAGSVSSAAVGDQSQPTYARKTYRQKLSLLDKPRPFQMLQRTKEQLLYLTWPLVFYCKCAT